MRRESFPPGRQSARNRPPRRTRDQPKRSTMTEISPLDQARILSEALPHMQQYDEETIVIKYGGDPPVDRRPVRPGGRRRPWHSGVHRAADHAAARVRIVVRGGPRLQLSPG